MYTATIIGLETEYAALIEGTSSPDLSRLFQAVQLPYHVEWDYQPERPWCDARGFMPAAQVSVPLELPLELIADPTQPTTQSPQIEDTSTEPIRIEQETPPNFMLLNGARFYLDHTHPEMSTPECATPIEVVLYDQAGDAWLSNLVANVNASRKEHGSVTIYKNNVDAYGNTYGGHENYLMDAATYRALFDQQAHRLYTILIPFLVSRQILCGSGKVAPLDRKGPLGFHISQRADFFETLLGLQTTDYRPIINTRDEALADPLRFRRLHVITGDSNLSEYSTYLKVGTTALVLEMLANDALRLDLTLADPLSAIRTISQDPTCQATVELETDRRRFTAIAIQRCFVEAAGKYLEERRDQSYRHQVWKTWAAILDALSENPSNLASKIDWAIKYEFLQAQMEQHGWTWTSPEVRKLDIKYHQLDPAQSLFHLLRKNGLIDSLLNKEEIRQAQSHPPQNTRAYLRVACLERYHERIKAVNWDTLVFTDQAGRTYRWRWGDPVFRGDDEYKRLLRESSGLEAFLQSILKYSSRKEDDGTGKNT